MFENLKILFPSGVLRASGSSDCLIEFGYPPFHETTL